MGENSGRGVKRKQSLHDSNAESIQFWDVITSGTYYRIYNDCVLHDLSPLNLLSGLCFVEANLEAVSVAEVAAKPRTTR